MIKYQTYSLGSVILVKSVVAAYINSFWLDVFHNFKVDSYLGGAKELFLKLNLQIKGWVIEQ
jgi:hypothetical protein